MQSILLWRAHCAVNRERVLNREDGSAQHEEPKTVHNLPIYMAGSKTGQARPSATAHSQSRSVTQSDSEVAKEQPLREKHRVNNTVPQKLGCGRCTTIPATCKGTAPEAGASLHTSMTEGDNSFEPIVLDHGLTKDVANWTDRTAGHLRAAQVSTSTTPKLMMTDRKAVMLMKRARLLWTTMTSNGRMRLIMTGCVRIDTSHQSPSLTIHPLTGSHPQALHIRCAWLL